MAERLPLTEIVAPLFVPGHRPERFGKATASGADAVIIDFEDAVPDEAKELARGNVRADLGVPVIVRVNAIGTPRARGRSARRGRPAGAGGVLLPKSEAGEGFADAVRACGGLLVLALVETAWGLASARQIAVTPGVGRLVFGSVDFSADLGCAHMRNALLAVRCELVLASRLGGLPAPIDGVTTALDDAALTAGDARHARDLGFGGTLCIHPRQVATVLSAFTPGEDEVAWARKVLANGEGAVAVDGAMVDEPVRVRARRILARSGPNTNKAEGIR